MESLRDVLQQYSGGALTLGSTEATKTAGNSNRQALQKALTDLSRRNERYFVIGMVMAVVLFAALLVVGFLQLNSPVPGKIIPPVFGTSAAVVVWRMFRTWREKNYTDCVLALVPNVDEATLKTIVNALVKKM